MVLATLPAGANRERGRRSRAVQQQMLRPWPAASCGKGTSGSRCSAWSTRIRAVLRHPSDGDFQGDSAWVGPSRGGEGIFGIGTAEGLQANSVAGWPAAAAACAKSGRVADSWYALDEGDRQYRPAAVQLTLGPDLALPLHEYLDDDRGFAEPLERLVPPASRHDVFRGGCRPAADRLWRSTIETGRTGTALRIVLEGKKAAYYWQRGHELLAVDPPAEPTGPRSVYLVLAELGGTELGRAWFSFSHYSTKGVRQWISDPSTTRNGVN